jgi:ComF family protein
LTGIRSVAFFEGPLQNALHRLKYQRDIILADSLARLLEQAWHSAGQPGGIVMPVPLSARRMQERGYNQAGLLARGFAELAGLRYAPRGLRRTKHTLSQVGLKADERQANVAGAFAAEPTVIHGQTVIVVDDVCTTGATLEACAEALRAAGATVVWALTLGRAR